MLDLASVATTSESKAKGRRMPTAALEEEGVGGSGG